MIFACSSILLSPLVRPNAAASAAKMAAETRQFDVPSGAADASLKLFSAQANIQVIYPTDLVDDIRTNAVRGNLTAAKALEQMVAGTPLVVVHDEKTGALGVRRQNGRGTRDTKRRDPAEKTPLLAPQGASAQTISRQRVAAVGESRATGTDPDPIIELSPFVVSSTSETGWVATETIAGTRLRTNLKDVPNQIEILTKDFMDDLGLTSLEQVMAYTTNVENAKNDYVPVDHVEIINNPTAAGRVRGVAAGTYSRNFFSVSYPTDNFNIERITVANGPNAILFGLGSPAGILDTTPARAVMQNKHGFELQFDSENSKRGTFDSNIVIAPEKLAIRMMGLSKREYTAKKPNLDRDERLYGALTFKPLKNTAIILQGEKSNRNWNRENRYPPVDRVSPWYNANQIPGSGYTTPSPTYNNSTFAGIGSNRIFAQAGDQPVLVEGGSGLMQNWRNSVVVKEPRTLPGVDPLNTNTAWTVIDPRIYPFDVNFIGTTRSILLGAYTKTAILEQKIARNLHLELAYNDEHSYNKRINSGGEELAVDANQFLPGTTTPNPNLGKFYVQGQADQTFILDKRQDWRAMLTYEVDLAKKFSDRFKWGQWLGRHRWFGMYTDGKYELKNQGGFTRRILDNPVLPGVALRAKTFQNWANHSTRRPTFRHYIDNPYDTPSALGPMIGDWSLLDANGAPYKLYQYDTPLVAPDGKRLGSQNAASASLNRTSGQLLAWQAYFLPDREQQSRLVLSAGYRRDRAKSARLDAPSTRLDFSGLFPVIWDTEFGEFGPAQTGVNRNLGVVARPLKWLSVHYSRSSTFDLNTGRYDPFGEPLLGAGGKGKDYGIRLDFWGDRVGLRLNRYESSAGPVRASQEFARFRNTFFAIENRALELNPSLKTINVDDGNMRGFRAAGAPSYDITADYVGKGYEMELNLRPTPNWNIRVNGAKTEAVESNIGLPWFAWVEARLPVWQSLVASNGEVTPTGQPVTWKTAPSSATNPTGETIEQAYNSSIVGNALAFMKAAAGRANDTHPMRANLITNYRFSEGRLKGFNVGGAVRWREASTIGYGAAPSTSGVMVFDLDKKYRGKEEIYFDAMAGYRGQLRAFGGIRYRLQMNVRNVLNKDDMIPVAALATGQVVRIASVEPRLFLFTVAFDF